MFCFRKPNALTVPRDTHRWQPAIPTETTFSPPRHPFFGWSCPSSPLWASVIAWGLGIPTKSVSRPVYRTRSPLESHVLRSTSRPGRRLRGVRGCRGRLGRVFVDFSSIYCRFFVFFVDLLRIFRRFIADFLYLLSFRVVFVSFSLSFSLTFRRSGRSGVKVEFATGGSGVQLAILRRGFVTF